MPKFPLPLPPNAFRAAFLLALNSLSSVSFSFERGEDTRRRFPFAPLPPPRSSPSKGELGRASSRPT